jgi:hypothetical protein
MIILGCITKYKPQDIRPYVESLNQTGYSDRKVMMVYDVPQETIDYLKENGWELYGGELEQHIILQRFRDIYKLLQTFTPDTIVWTDVKDVIFQQNPQTWLVDDRNMKKDILCFSECIKLGDDPWATINSGTTFPLEWETMKEQTSYCAGTIVGRTFALRDLFLEIYHWSKLTHNPDQLADQAAFNILINLYHFKDSVQFVEQEEGFVTQMGTVHIKKDEFKDVLLEPSPVINRDGYVYNQKGELFSIVHQYDRDPKLKQLVYNRYK